MLRTINQKSRGLLASLGLLAGVAVSSVAATADATGSPTTPTTVIMVEYSSYATGTLTVQVAGSVNYFGQVSAQTGCTANNQTVDTLKMWQSLAQAALLSGKTVKIYYNVCGTGSNQFNYIYALDLNG